MTEIIFLNTSLILGIAVTLALLAQLLRQPLIISYILTGIVCGPLFLNLVNSGQEFFSAFSQFGVILLLFLVGLSVSFDYLRQIGKTALITGVAQVIFTSGIGFFILSLLGLASTPALYLAIAITFSSTIIITKLLAEKRESRNLYARYIIGLMLVQDLIAMALLVLLPTFKSGIALLPAFLLVYSKSVILFIVIYLFSQIVITKFLDKIAGSKEFLFIFSIAWCFLVAAISFWTGLGMEVGAIVAGLTLGSSVYRDEISSRLRPLRDFFIIIFFVILGSEIHVEDLGSVIGPSLVLSFFILFGNPLILYWLYRLLKFDRRNSFLIALTAAQVSEFGFVFLFICQKLGYIENKILSIFTLVALITIFVSSYLIKYNSWLYERISPWLKKFGHDKHLEKKQKEIIYDVIVIGYHRLGWKICEVLRELKISFAVIDADPAAIVKLENRKIPCYFGDVNDVEFLEDLPLACAKMIISTLPEGEDQIVLVKHIREKSKQPIIITNLSHASFANELYASGADYVLLPHHISGEWLAGVLKGETFDRKMFRRLTRQQKKEMTLRFNLGHD